MQHLRSLDHDGMIPHVTVGGGSRGTRWRLADLDAFIANHTVPQRKWSANAPELPGITAARIIGVSRQHTYDMQSDGRLKDYSPQSIREFIEQRARAKMLREVEALMQARYSATLKKLRFERWELRNRIACAKCTKCAGPLMRFSHYTPAARRRSRARARRRNANSK